MKHFIALIAGSIVIAAAGVALGNARDADGSRMQARSHSLGDRATDRLAPPGDVVDWRYIRVKKTDTVQFTVESSPKDVQVTMQVMSAVGKKISTHNSKNGSIKTKRKLEAGLYYVSIGARDSVNYELLVQ